MSDSTSIAAERGVPVDAGARWFVPELELRPLAARRAHVRNPLNRATTELSSDEYAVLAACEGCATLDEHVSIVARKLSAPAEHRPAFRSLLERCAAEGVIVSLSALVPGAEREPPTTLGAIAIRTCDRPQLLARLLASAAHLEASARARRRWFVFDDSRDAESAQANRDAVERATIDVSYRGRAEAAELEGFLGARFPDGQREITWLLGAGSRGEATYGRPLNHALLAFAGHRFLAIDDDVILEPHRPAMCDAGFAVGDRTDELRWYGSEEEMWRDCPAVDIDPIAQHERWLGLPLGEAWARCEREAGALAEVDLRAHLGVRFTADARVVFTHNHACGDPGSAMLPLQLLALPPLSRRWIASHPEEAARAFGSRINWRGQSRLRLGADRILTLTTIAGLDNSRLLPPAARACRSEDVLLGIATQCLYPGAWFVDLPFALPHLREPKKQWLPANAGFMQEPLHVLYAWIDENARDVAPRDPEARLAAMGAMLIDYARMSDSALSEALRLHAVDAASRTLFAIEEQLADPELPAQWKAQLSPWLKSPALAVDEQFVRARVLAPGVIRPLAAAYGRAMQLWPDLWRCCRDRNGERLGMRHP
jgi:hypothetical protein